MYNYLLLITVLPYIKMLYKHETYYSKMTHVTMNYDCDYDCDYGLQLITYNLQLINYNYNLQLITYYYNL